MTADRYLKLILTVIAFELLWLGIRGDTVRLFAQSEKQQPLPVVVTGFRIADQDYTTIPVAVVGGWRPVPGHREFHMMQPVQVRISEPVQFDTRQPVTVQTGNKPLSVESVPAKPGPRPGLQ